MVGRVGQGKEAYHERAKFFLILGPRYPYLVKSSLMSCRNVPGLDVLLRTVYSNRVDINNELRRKCYAVFLMTIHAEQ